MGSLPVGERLRLWRKHRKLTLAELGEPAGIGEAAVSKIETGKQIVKEPQLAAMVGRLELTMAEFYETLPPAEIADADAQAANG